MGDHRDIGDLVRTLRMAAGLSQRDLARRLGYAQPVVARIETGARPPTREQLEALDRALNLGGLLSEGEDDMDRRAVLTLAGVAGALGLTMSPEQMLEVVERMSMHTPETRASAVQSLMGEYLSATRAPEFGRRLLEEASAARRLASKHSASLDDFRSAAQLSLLVGLWLAGKGNISAGHTWCAQAVNLAVLSKDAKTEADVRGWWAARGAYEGWSRSQAIEAAQRALTVSPGPTMGALHAHAALAHVAGLTEQLDDGRRAVWAMIDVAERLDDDDWMGPARAALFAVYIEGRLGSPAAAERAYEAAVPLTRGTAWWPDTVTYGAMGKVRGGNVAEGVQMVLDCARSDGDPTHLHVVGWADLLRAVQATRPGYRSDELDELRNFVPVTTARPWETVRS